MEDSESDKTELPTPFKLERSRKKGVVARGADLGFFAGLAGAIAYYWIAGRQTAATLAQVARTSFIEAPRLADGHHALLIAVASLASTIVAPLVLLFAAVFSTVLLVELVQTGVVFSVEPLRPDFSRLSPANGIKRVFSLRALIETGKSILKIAVYGTIGILFFRAIVNVRVAAVSDAPSLLAELRASAGRLLVIFALGAVFFAVIDQIIVRGTFLKRMRMSRRELRRETRDREGEPRLRQKRKQLHRELTKSRQSLRNLRKADVLITNPQHIALALHYDPKNMPAPKVVSVGLNHFAQRLKRMAFLYNIPIVENRALAQALHRKSALNGTIPPECFRPVADIYNAIRERKRVAGLETANA